ncbi:MAG TPA: type II secretion system F family protein, partial [Gemmatimonadaceae bacterium]|nr:type II secretion system F family protein [Gemmatimonadaceae bacterium]
AAAYVVVDARGRRRVIARLEGGTLAAPTAGGLLTSDDTGWAARIGAWASHVLPASWVSSEAAAGKLVHAGFDGRTAPALYVVIRLACAVVLPLLAVTFAPQRNMTHYLMFVGLAAAIGLLGPPGVLDHLATKRQTRVRQAVPDALDLLVVCVEAGVSLDAAMLRVARDMDATHPDLAREFLFVNRRTNAGVSREVALHGLWHRTGLEELRGLASSMVQSEKWGTSIAKVLRVYAETLRRKRKQTAEKRAAEAAVKMLFPLMLFLLPALFVVIIGPGAMKISDMLKVMGGN